MVSKNKKIKTMKKLILKICCPIILLVSVLSLNSCSDDSKQTVEQNRLFRPILRTGVLVSQDNAITINMSPLTDAVGYKIELSLDNFVTTPLVSYVLMTSNSSTANNVTITNLLWNTTYYVRAYSLASDPKYDSYAALFGPIKTAPFPNIIKTPLPAEILNNGIITKWSLTGNAVTQVKIFDAATLPAVLTPESIIAASPLFSFNTNSSEQIAGSKSISGLTPSTAYVVAMYSDSVLRGYGAFTTKP
jgi:hypothetical protein